MECIVRDDARISNQVQGFNDNLSLSLSLRRRRNKAVASGFMPDVFSVEAISIWILLDMNYPYKIQYLECIQMDVALNPRKKAWYSIKLQWMELDSTH